MLPKFNLVCLILQKLSIILSLIGVKFLKIMRLLSKLLLRQDLHNVQQMQTACNLHFIRKEFSLPLPVGWTLTMELSLLDMNLIQEVQIILLSKIRLELLGAWMVTFILVMSSHLNSEEVSVESSLMPSKLFHDLTI